MLTLIDISGLIYTTYYRHSKKGFNKSNPVLQAKRALINLILPAIQKDYKAVLLFDKKDSSKKYWRQHFLELNNSVVEYKEKNNSKIINQAIIQPIRIAAKDLTGAFASFIFPGLEADDLAGLICKYKKPETKIDIFSGDRDLAGLVNDSTNIRWIQANFENRYAVETEAAVVEYFKHKVSAVITNPSEVYKFKAKMGDKSDNLPKNSAIELVDLINYSAPKAFGFAAEHEKVKNWLHNYEDSL